MWVYSEAGSITLAWIASLSQDYHSKSQRLLVRLCHIVVQRKYCLLDRGKGAEIHQAPPRTSGVKCTLQNRQVLAPLTVPTEVTLFVSQILFYKGPLFSRLLLKSDFLMTECSFQPPDEVFRKARISRDKRYSLLCYVTRPIQNSFLFMNNNSSF